MVWWCGGTVQHSDIVVQYSDDKEEKKGGGFGGEMS